MEHATFNKETFKNMKHKTLAKHSENIGKFKVRNPFFSKFWKQQKTRETLKK